MFADMDAYPSSFFRKPKIGSFWIVHVPGVETALLAAQGTGYGV
jgi:hypothetical protein